MKIVFYSTNSNTIDNSTFVKKSLPSNDELFLQFKKNHPEDQFYCIAQNTGFFMPETDCILVSAQKDYKDFASEIIKLNPDVAVAFSYWVTPFDWLPVQDALVADILRENKITVFCNEKKFCYDCFNKYETTSLLKNNGFNVAKSIYVHHDMYFCASNRREININVYKNYILEQIKKMNFPLIIKDTTGLSSFGMQVVNTYGEAVNYLNSKRNNSDRLVEEMISGEQFGIEIWGNDNNFKVFPPFMFSVNQYGITSPKQSVKIGPVTNECFNVSELQDEMKRLAEVVKLNGIMQVDLVFHEGKWFVIEINPRLSGMTFTYANFYNTDIYEMIYNVFILNDSDKLKSENQNNFTLNIKYPLLSDNELQNLKKEENVEYICQIEDKEAKQEREKGYCEVVISNIKSKNLLKQKMMELKNNYPEISEETFFNNAFNMIEKI